MKGVGDFVILSTHIYRRGVLRRLTNSGLSPREVVDWYQSFVIVLLYFLWPLLYSRENHELIFWWTRLHTSCWWNSSGWVAAICEIFGHLRELEWWGFLLILCGQTSSSNFQGTELMMGSDQMWIWDRMLKITHV